MSGLRRGTVGRCFAAPPRFIMLNLALDDSAFSRQLTNLERAQLPFAAANALNDTAADVLAHMQDRMKVVFDRPTRFTLNAFMVWRATKSRLEAQVKERPSMGRRHYLKVQESGGPRPATGLEGLLTTRLAYQGFIAAVTPAGGARLDAFGNWSVGERNQALSALGAQRDARSNTTEASRKRKPGRATYFVPRNGGLSPGVYKRSGPKAEPVKVLNFVERVPVYSERLGFYDGAEQVWRARLPGHLNRRLEQAVASAR